MLSSHLLLGLVLTACLTL